MPFQLPPSAVGLLKAGQTLLYGNRPDNLVVALVIGPGAEPGSTRIRLLENYHTRRTTGGDSSYRAGAEITAKAAKLWRDAVIPLSLDERSRFFSG